MQRFIEVDELRQLVQYVRKHRDRETRKINAGFAEFDVPASLRDGLRDYITDGVPTGSFLEACINNDLAEACGRADETNRRLLFEIMCWLHNAAPMGAWHYDGAMTRWVEIHQQEREREKREAKA